MLQYDFKKVVIHNRDIYIKMINRHISNHNTY